MDWMNQIGGMLQNYMGGQAGGDVHGDFDQVAQHAPNDMLADGLAAAFRSNQTPPFGQMLGQLFGQSSGEQRASILNTLISYAGPTIAAQVLQRSGASGLAGLLGGGGQQEITPEQAQDVSPDAVQELAQHAEQKDPSVIDTISNIYAQHPTLVKTLGAAALSIVMAKMAQRTQAS